MIKMKKSAAAIFLLMSANSFAAMYSAPPVLNTQAVTYPKEGVYLGAGIGASFNDYQLQSTDVINNNSNTLTSDDTSALGNVFLGYGHTFNNVWYLGGEANIYFPNQTVNFNNRPSVNDPAFHFNDQFSVDDNITVDLLPGYRVTPTDLLYARVGMDFRDVTMNQQATINPGTESFSNSANQIGERFGVGLTHALSEHFAASVDYFYTYFPRFGSYWTDETIQFDMTSHSNYVGLSLAYTV